MPSKYCGKLPRCKNSWWCAVDYRPTDNVHCFEPLTNADKIRAMTDEEMAEWLDNIDTAYEPETVVSRHGWLEWLKQEVTE